MRRGSTLVELTVVVAILALAGSMFAQTMTVSRNMDPVGVQTAIAAEGARSFLEEMHNHPFREIFKLYNDDPNDDPKGVGTAPGSRFDIEGLVPVPPNTSVGRVSFPQIGKALREDVDDPVLCMPRDLNADGIVDSVDHSQDCIVLPLRVDVVWKTTSGKDGRRTFTVYGMFADL